MSDHAAMQKNSSLMIFTKGSLVKQTAIVFLGSLFITALSQITVPFYPVPMTLQTLAIMLIGLTFGFRLATATVALYLVEGAIGLPVLAGFSSGLAPFAGPTGGYLIGFLVEAMAIGFLADKGFSRGILSSFAVLLAGDIIVFAFGIAYLSSLSGFDNALKWGLYPFLLGELCKLALATLIGNGVLKGARHFANL